MNILLLQIKLTCFWNKMIVPSIPEHVSRLVPSVHWCSVGHQLSAAELHHTSTSLGWDTGTTQGKESDVRTDEKLLIAVL